MTENQLRQKVVDIINAEHGQVRHGIGYQGHSLQDQHLVHDAHLFPAPAVVPLEAAGTIQARR